MTTKQPKQRWLLTSNNTLINLNHVLYIKPTNSIDNYIIMVKMNATGESECLYSARDRGTRDEMFNRLLEAIGDKSIDIVKMSDIILTNYKYYR